MKSALGLSPVLLLLGACTSAHEPCATTDDCTEWGEVCIDELCLSCVSDEECASGPVYGAASFCADGACCQVGSLDCACFDNQTCGWGSTCGGGLRCVECPAGSVRCPCGPDGACDGGSICMEGVCAPPDCELGQSDCPCTSEGRCDPGLTCSEERICVRCVAGEAHCPCHGTDRCAPGLTCREGICDACEDGLRDCPCAGSGECASGLECVEGRCALIERTCAELDCLSQGRVCEGEPFAQCTSCDGQHNFVPDGRGQCIEAPGACQSSVQCNDGEYCLRLSLDGPATCLPAPPCTDLEPTAGASGAAWDADVQGCVPCASCADVVGSTGRLWPTTVGRSCVCETEDGYYFDTAFAAMQPRECDADGDGWVQFPARQYVVNADVALRDNARCDVRWIDGFVLQNERGERRRIELSELNVAEPRLGLYESVRTDEQAKVDADPYMPAYGGRAPRAEELHPMTKACVTAAADYNANSIPDLDEHVRSRSSQAWMEVFWRLGYFVELHRGWFEPDASRGEDQGAFVIAERRRCDADFALGYAIEGDYWRECTRRRRADFDADAGAPGWDFAAWTCADPTGSCPPPRAAVLTDGEADPESGAVVGATTDDDLVPLHGSCTSTAPSDPYAHWSGMGHHSQFSCVQFFDVLEGDPATNQRGTIMHGVEGGYDANLCGLTAVRGPDMHDAVHPEVECVIPGVGTASTTALVDGAVGFAAARYQDAFTEEDYELGCINECPSYKSLCPNYHDLTEANQAGCESNALDFGRLSCNGCPRAGTPCLTTNTGACRAGTWRCEEELEICRPNLVVDLTRPDPVGDGIDANCDGFDGDSTTGVFVSPFGFDGAPGTPSAPMQHITAAIQRADALTRADSQGRQFNVYAAAGVYFAEYGSGDVIVRALEIRDGVSIYGGFLHAGPELLAVTADHPEFRTECPFELDGEQNPVPTFAWCRPALPASTPLTEVIPSQDSRVAIRAEGITRPTTIEFLRAVENPRPSNGPTSSYGALITNSRPADGVNGLVFRSCVIAAVDAHGTYGPPTATTERAFEGRPGGKGGRGCEDSGFTCRNCSQPSGGAGGQGCNTVSGGRGGTGGVPGHKLEYGADGDPGLISARNPDCICNGQCARHGADERSGGPGTAPGQGDYDPGFLDLPQDGEAGGDGPGGCPGYRVFGASGYRGVPGETGARGGDGSGGGGGGGGGGGDNGCDSYGGGGGGGGGGGCGGGGGGGGQSGGGSFGAYLWNSAVTFEDCVITAGSGGDGVSGAAGQPGGFGGEGGRDRGNRGNPYGGSGEQDDGSNGTRGADGGDGGDGGYGGGGAGGPSYGIFLGGSDGTTVSTADRINTLITYGGGGRAGISFNPLQPTPGGAAEVFTCRTDRLGSDCDP